MEFSTHLTNRSREIVKTEKGEFTQKNMFGNKDF
jgi:hypothetical protein